jgi:hypothetical protein
MADQLDVLRQVGSDDAHEQERSEQNGEGIGVGEVGAMVGDEVGHGDAYVYSVVGRKAGRKLGCRDVLHDPAGTNLQTRAFQRRCISGRSGRFRVRRFSLLCRRVSDGGDLAPSR